MNEHELKGWLAQAGFDVSEPLDIERTIANAATPLMHAARLGNVGVLKALLARGAAVHKMNADNNGALWFACFADSEPCASALNPVRRAA